MRLNITLEIDLDRFVDPAVLQYPEDVVDILKSHYDSIQHMLEEADVEWYAGRIVDDRSGFACPLLESDLRK